MASMTHDAKHARALAQMIQLCPHVAEEVDGHLLIVFGPSEVATMAQLNAQTTHDLGKLDIQISLFEAQAQLFQELMIEPLWAERDEEHAWEVAE